MIRSSDDMLLDSHFSDWHDFSDWLRNYTRFVCHTERTLASNTGRPAARKLYRAAYSWLEERSRKLKKEGFWKERTVYKYKNVICSYLLVCTIYVLASSI